MRQITRFWCSRRLMTDERAGQAQVPPVEGPRHEVVEPVVVDARQPLGALHVRPDPALEAGLDLGELLLGRLGVGRVQHPVLAVGILPGVVDLRDHRVQRVVQQLARVAALGAPLRRGGGLPGEGLQVDRPRRHLDGVAHHRLDADHLGREPGHHLGRDPRRAQPGGDVGRPQVLGLHQAQRGRVAGVAGLQRRRGLGRRQLGPHRAGQVGVRRLPHLEALGGQGRVQEHRLSELGQGLLARAADQLRHPGQVHVPDLVQGHGQGVGRRGDDRLDRRVDHPLAEHRARLGGVALDVVILDRRHQPAVRVVQERLQVRPAHRVRHLARGLVGPVADRGVVDGAELPDEAVVGHAQAGLQRAPGLVRLLRPQHRPHRVAHRDQAAQDARVLGEDALLHGAGLYRHGPGLAVEHLVQRVADQDVAALLDRGALGRGADHDPRGLGAVGLGQVRRRQAHALGQDRQGTAEGRLDVHALTGAAGVDRAILAAGPGVLAQHHLRVVPEVAVGAQRTLAIGVRRDLDHVRPLDIAPGRFGVMALKHQNIDHDLGAGIGLHGALRHPHRAHQVGQAGDVLARRGHGLVHGPARGDEGRHAAGLQALDRAGDEVVVQGQAEPAGRIVRPHRAIRERRVAHHHVVALGQPGLGEVLGPDPRLREQLGRDPRGDRVGLDPGQRRLGRGLLRHQRQEQARCRSRAPARCRR